MDGSISYAYDAQPLGVNPVKASCNGTLEGLPQNASLQKVRHTPNGKHVHCGELLKNVAFPIQDFLLLSFTRVNCQATISLTSFRLEEKGKCEK